MDVMERVVLGLGAALLLFFLSAGITSLLEKERRAARASLILGIFLSLPFLLPLMKGISYPVWISIALVSVAGCCLALLLLPIRGQIRYTRQRPTRRMDERDTMFSRQELVPGSKRFEEYYGRRPQHFSPDENFRSKPGWLSPGSKYHDPVLFAATRSLFERVKTLHPRVEGKPAQERINPDSSSFTKLLLDTAGKLGAHSAGITALHEYHVYSTGGRGDRYGQAYAPVHPYAIALTVEMDYHRMRTAPAAPTLVESAKQYYESGKIAVELAEYIRNSGYEARAHIDANYQVVCPLVARDAGLGEIGRMGLLMTPSLGPRVRIAVVTTDMPLEPTPAKPDISVTDFCRRCEKCAIVCPGRSIPFGPERKIDGVLRWQIHSESCFTYWCQAGTDCGRCVVVCPFAHPDNWFHRLVRSGIRNSRVFRRLALPLDDLFYGKRPRPRDPRNAGFIQP
jgi:reductive dehalogenase